jgi:uroporphyrinogen-III synthase
MRLLVTRAEPDASLEAEKLVARGHEPVLAPLLAIEFVGDVTLELAGAQALIVTSRNALRALASHRQLDEARKLPLYAVGDVTALAATKLGFKQVTQGPGTGAALGELIVGRLKPGGAPLVHLAGETVAFDLKSALAAEGFRVLQPVLYRAVPAHEFPAKALSLLRAGRLHGAILMSPRTATTFALLLDRHRLVTEGRSLICYCLSEAVAEAVAPLGARVRVAAHPREEDVLALVDSEAASS